MSCLETQIREIVEQSQKQSQQPAELDVFKRKTALYQQECAKLEGIACFKEMVWSQLHVLTFCGQKERTSPSASDRDLFLQSIVRGSLACFEAVIIQTCVHSGTPKHFQSNLCVVDLWIFWSVANPLSCLEDQLNGCHHKEAQVSERRQGRKVLV